MKRVILKKGREASVRRRHPWVFSGAIDTVEGEPQEGEVVQVWSKNKEILGMGHYASSSITVKMLRYGGEIPDENWFQSRLREAHEQRMSLNLPSEDTNAYRLIHGEGDGLPGLVIDIYDELAVIQVYSKGMERMLDLFKSELIAMGIKNILAKTVGKGDNSVLAGEIPERVQIKENGMLFWVDPSKGQKTGFFIDQRDNRALVGKYSKDKRVLNAFSYTGGFSVAAALGGASEVHSLDSSAQALELAVENAALNGVGDRHSILNEDAVKFLENTEERYDLIVLDPPAFAKHKSARYKAIQAYRRINEAAMLLLNPGGMLLTFSCSQVVDTVLFNNTVVSAAIGSGLSFQDLGHLRQPSDHPVLITHPEGDYLKGMWLRKML